jgi:DNA-binding beta-propeller fold protein YncE
MKYGITTAQPTGIRYLSLPSNSMPMGIVYNPYNSMVYVALYGTSQLAEINKTDFSYSLYNILDSAWDVAVDGDGNVWVAGSYRYVAKFLISNKTVQYIDLQLPTPRIACSITYFNGYIWVLNCEFLTKINYTTNAIEMQYTLPEQSYSGDMKGDGNILWITRTDNSKVYMFNITSGVIQNTLLDLNRPLGIEIDENYVYVAENRQQEPVEFVGTIARIDKKTLQVDRLYTTLCGYDGPYHVFKDSYGYLWFTDGSHHLGIVNGVIYTTKTAYCYFMTEVPTHSSEIWFSAVGSAYIGMKDIGTLGNTDINKDGKVDIKDVSYVSKWFGSLVPPAPENADLNSDGKIDIKDVSAVSRNFGKTL